MTTTCPAGHTSDSNDYCDVCGAPIGVAAGAPAATGGSAAGGSAAGGSAAGGSPAAGAPQGAPGAAAGSGSLLDLGPAGAGPAGAGPAGAGNAGQTCPHCGAVSVPGSLFCEDCGYDFTTGQLPRTDPAPLLPPDGVAMPGVHPGAGGASSLGAAPGPDSAPGLGGAPAGLTPPPLPADASTPPLAGGAPPPLPGDTSAAVPPGQQGPVEWVAEVWVDPDWHAAQEVSEPCPSPGMPEVVPLRGTTQLVGRRSVSRNIHPQIDCGADTGVSRRHAQLTTDGQRWWVEDLQSSNGTYVSTAGGPLPDVPVPAGQRTELPDDARVYLGAWTRIVVRAATAEEASMA